MPHRETSPISKRFTILIGLSVVGAMTFGLSISFYKNILFEETLHGLAEQNREIRIKIDDGLQLLAYYQSRQYKDKYAKESLGRINPDEHVLIITGQKNIPTKNEEAYESWMEKREAEFHQYLENIPILEHWKLYLFDAKELIMLRQTF